MRFSVTPTFAAKARMSWPSEDTANGFKPVEFDCRFKAIENDPAKHQALKKKQSDEGPIAFLNEVLIDVKFRDGDEFADDEGNALTAIEFVKRNKIAAGAASIAFWDVINRDIEAKNSKS